ncbi:MAG: transcription antitermination factor NusB [Desulfobacterales bacterium]|nr:transcription antitermination factor NusB [Desulfobacterales bacterium]
MGLRRKAREAAMQFLFAIDANKEKEYSEYLELFCDDFEINEDIIPFFRDTVNGVLQYKSEIDSLIERFSEHWKVYRMSRVDRNLLRISVYELIYRDDIPSVVSINEAIDIGKRFGTKDSGSFINGLLDKIKNNINELKQKE